MITKVISGGQIGADIAGLRAAHTLKIPTGGTAPLGFKTKNGPNPKLGTTYGLTESPYDWYAARTLNNILDSDGTIMLYIEPNSPGELLTRNTCRRTNHPHFEINLKRANRSKEAILKYVEDAVKWIEANNIQTLNIAGNGMVAIERMVYLVVVDILVRANHITKEVTDVSI